MGSFIFEQIVNGIITGSQYALIAAGMTMIFGVLRAINFAHGEYYMLGTFAAWLVISRLEVHYAVAIVLGVAIAALIAAVIGRFVMQRLVGAPFQAGVLATIGISLILQNAVILAFGGGYKVFEGGWLQPVELFGFGMAQQRIVLIVVAIGVFAAQKGCATPIVPIWMSDRMGEGYRMLVEHGFAPPRSVGKGIKAIMRWVEYGRWKRAHRSADTATPTAVLPAALATRSLSEAQAKQQLLAAGVRLLPNGLARTPQEARAMADGMGYPVVAKIASEQIVHKSDIGGPQVDLQDAQQVGEAWRGIMASVAQHRSDAAIDGLLIEKMAPRGGLELMVGVTRDPVFGHVMTLGLGGIYVEILRDVTRRMLPLGAGDAAAMIREMRCFPLLAGARGRPPADVEALEALLLRISAFVVQNADRIEEMDLNPVWVGAVGEGALPLDAVIIERSAQEVVA